ncbi:MAG: helix-turn-helix domain-containing protein [Rhodopirellula sp.]|nr:helix-turn-helix domain-containing protein [Rhodopirellula sp.]
MSDPSLRISPVPRLALSLEESAKAVGLCSKTVGNLIRDGRLRAVHVGTRRLVPVSELQRWLDAEAAQPSELEGQANGE